VLDFPPSLFTQSFFFYRALMIVLQEDLASSRILLSLEWTLITLQLAACLLAYVPTKRQTIEQAP
jgi:hypothetical protein